MERLNKTRREFVKILAAATVTGKLLLLLSSCANESLPPVVPIYHGPDKSPFPLYEQSFGILTDGLTSFRRPYLDAIMFSFDPNRAGGSLVMNVALKKDMELRMIIEETDKLKPKNPGLIYAQSTIEKTGDIIKYPVIRFAPYETYLISLGFKAAREDCQKTYKDMETYFITRDENGRLEGRLEGVRTFNPDAAYFKARDDEAKLYFDKGCLS